MYAAAYTGSAIPIVAMSSPEALSQSRQHQDCACDDWGSVDRPFTACDDWGSVDRPFT